MGSCLAPILANIILTEFQKELIEDLIQPVTILNFTAAMRMIPLF